MGLNHRLIVEPFLPGQQTSLAFPQAGVECQHPTTVLGLTDPSSEQPNTLLCSEQLYPGPQPEQEDQEGGKKNPIAKQTEEEGGEQ